MEKKFKLLLESYLQLTERKYRESIKEKRNGVFKLYHNKELEFSKFIIDMESHLIFDELVKETYKFKYGYYFKKKESKLDFSLNEMKRKIINYFKRSGCYYDIFTSREDVFSNYTLIKYLDALTRKEKEQNYFAPMEYVGFAEHLMDFDQFRIQKVTADELDNMLNNKINKIFFKRSYIKMEQLKELEDYWFICFTKKYPVQEYRGKYRIKIDQDFTHADIEFAQFPIEILPIIKILSLFDWKADWLKNINRDNNSIETSAIKFRIPFVLITDDDLLELPKAAPDFTILKTELVNMINNNGSIDVYEVPERNIILNKERTDNFITFIAYTNRLYSSLRIDENGWHFLNLSLDFYLKGFFSNGLEQLLWNITSIEALLGGKDGGYEKDRDGISKQEGLTEKLSRRIGLILTKERSHQKEIKEDFKDLYDYRCDLVHGNMFENRALIKHILKTRDICRKIILNYIYYLYKIQCNLSDNEKVTRESILFKIDINLINDFPIMPYS